MFWVILVVRRLFLIFWIFRFQIHHRRFNIKVSNEISELLDPNGLSFFVDGHIVTIMSFGSGLAWCVELNIVNLVSISGMSACLLLLTAMKALVSRSAYFCIRTGILLNLVWGMVTVILLIFFLVALMVLNARHLQPFLLFNL